MAALFLSRHILPRAIFYIDGFNLYYGAVKDTPYKWLDIQRLCESLRPQDEIVAVRYFTSLVNGQASAQRQSAFLQAIATRPLIKTQLGKFTKKPVSCEVSQCLHGGSRQYQVTVEKRTDVNIGAHMVNDAASAQCDVIALISGDTDLVPAVRLIRNEYPGRYIAVYVPVPQGTDTAKERRSDELRKAAHRGGFLAPHLVRDCQLPDPVIDQSTGREIRKPASW